MDKNSLTTKIHSLLRQRNIIAILLILMITSNIFLSIKLYSQKQVTILIPSEITDTYNINGSKFSESYLIDRTSEIVKTIFNITPQNIDFMREAVLRMVHPSSYSTIKKQLFELSEIVRLRRVTTVFFPISIKVNAKDLTCEVEGQLQSYLGQISTSEHKIYKLKFANTGVKLALIEFYEIQPNEISKNEKN